MTVYSPDFNPIELMWPKVKAVLRQLKAMSWEDLQKALKMALAAITLDDISGWFKHDKYIQ
jgi:transposase